MRKTVVQPDADAGANADANASSAGPSRPGPESIEELFAALESPLLYYALRLLNDRQLAEDVVQEAFMKLHVHFAEVQEPRRWLYRTVHNRALNHRRESAKIIRLDVVGSDDASGSAEKPMAPLAASTASTADTAPLPDEQIIRWEGIGLVRLSLAALDERSREIVRLKFNEDLSYKQIADRTGLTATHVGYLLHHALKAISAELARTGLTK